MTPRREGFDQNIPPLEVDVDITSLAKPDKI